MSVNLYDEKTKQLIPIAGNPQGGETEVVVSTEKPTDGTLIWVNPDGDESGSNFALANVERHGINGVAQVLKCNNIVILTLNLFSSVSKTNELICTIPEGFRPKTTINTVTYQGNTGRNIVINTDGTIYSTMDNINEFTVDYKYHI